MPVPSKRRYGPAGSDTATGRAAERDGRLDRGGGRVHGEGERAGQAHPGRQHDGDRAGQLSRDAGRRRDEDAAARRQADAAAAGAEDQLDAGEGHGGHGSAGGADDALDRHVRREALPQQPDDDVPGLDPQVGTGRQVEHHGAAADDEGPGHRGPGAVDRDAELAGVDTVPKVRPGTVTATAPVMRPAVPAADRTKAPEPPETVTAPPSERLTPLAATATSPEGVVSNEKSPVSAWPATESTAPVAVNAFTTPPVAKATASPARCCPRWSAPRRSRGRSCSP
jgi:hypothetical protein